MKILSANQVDWAHWCENTDKHHSEDWLDGKTCLCFVIVICSPKDRERNRTSFLVCQTKPSDDTKYAWCLVTFKWMDKLLQTMNMQYWLLKRKSFSKWTTVLAAKIYPRIAKKHFPHKIYSKLWVICAKVPLPAKGQLLCGRDLPRHFASSYFNSSIVYDQYTCTFNAL